MNARYPVVCLFALLFLWIAARPAQCQRLSPEEFASQLRLAEVYEGTRDFQNAVRVYEKLWEADSNSTAVFNGLLRNYFSLKHYESAEKLIKNKLQRSADSFDLNLLLARAEAFLDKKSAAMDAFEKARSSVPNDDCMQLMPIASALTDVNYVKEANELLSKITAGENPNCAGQAANLYLRLGNYAQATKQYLVLLAAGESNLPIVEQRIAQFTTDSSARALTLGALKESISEDRPSLSSLQLLAWMYGEEKDYTDAYDLVLRIDSINGKAHGSQGFELLIFAEKARNEGAIDVAVKAYEVAIRRIQSGAAAHNEYFLGQAQLGALMTREAALVKQPLLDTASLRGLIHDYEVFGEKQSANEFALSALVRAGELSFSRLFDLQRASRDFEKTLARARGYSDNFRDAQFGLADAALASSNPQQAITRLDNIDQLLDKRNRFEDKESRMHVLYSRAKIAYYTYQFDSARTLLGQIMEDPGSDYANDAIQLAGMLDESNKPAGLSVLKLYATAQFAEFKRSYAEALTSYQTIVDTYAASSLADDAAIKLAEVQVHIGKSEDALRTLETMQEKMTSSPLLDEAAFRAAEIVERELHDPKRAQKMYEDFLTRFQRSNFDTDARERARRLRGDVF
jgi:TolA-binding protein